MNSYAKIEIEAKKEYVKGNKDYEAACCKSPDFASAIINYDRALKKYKILMRTIEVKDIYSRLIDCNLKIYNHLGVAIKYEEFGDYLKTQDSEYFNVIDVYQNASIMFLKIGDNVRSITVLLKLIKYMTHSNMSSNESITDVCNKTLINIDNLIKSQNHYKINFYQDIFSCVVKYLDVATTTNVIKKMIIIYNELNQLHNVHLMMMSHILFLISKNELSTAYITLNEYYSQYNFITSDECSISRNIVFVLSDIKNKHERALKFNSYIKSRIVTKINNDIYKLLKNTDVSNIKYEDDTADGEVDLT